MSAEALDRPGARRLAAARRSNPARAAGWSRSRSGPSAPSPSVASVRDSCRQARSPASSRPPPARSAACWANGRAGRSSYRPGRRAARPSQPPASGRLTAKIRPAIASHPERHDQPLPQPGIAARHPVGRQQEHHRPPADRLVPALVDQVDDDRQRDQRQGRQQQRLQEAHRHTPLRVASARRGTGSALARSPRRCDTR